MDVFLFATAIISLLVTNLAIYLLCKHKKLRMLVPSLALQQVREVGAGRGHYRMHLQNSNLYNFGINCYTSGPSNVCSSILQKIKAVQRMLVL